MFSRFYFSSKIQTLFLHKCSLNCSVIATNSLPLCNLRVKQPYGYHKFSGIRGKTVSNATHDQFIYQIQLFMSSINYINNSIENSYELDVTCSITLSFKIPSLERTF